MKKRLIPILAMVFLVGNLLACKKEHVDRDGQINIFKEYYTEEKKHREDSLEIAKGDSSIEVSIEAVSGEVKVIFLDKDNEAFSYEYIVKEGDTANDIIQLDEDSLEDNWVIVMEKNEDTEASIKYVIK